MKKAYFHGWNVTLGWIAPYIYCCINGCFRQFLKNDFWWTKNLLIVVLGTYICSGYQASTKCIIYRKHTTVISKKGTGQHIFCYFTAWHLTKLGVDLPVTKGCCKVFLLAWVGNHFLLQSGGGQTFIFSPLDIIFIIVNHVINTSFFTPPFTPPPLSYSRNLSILLQFKVFWGGDSKRRCYASSHSQALVICVPIYKKMTCKIFLTKNYVWGVPTARARECEVA